VSHHIISKDKITSHHLLKMSASSINASV